MYFYSFRDFASTETIDTSALATKKERLDNLDQANAEIEKLCNAQKIKQYASNAALKQDTTATLQASTRAHTGS